MPVFYDNRHVVEYNSLDVDGPCTLVHVCPIITQHITLKLKDNNVYKYMYNETHITGLNTGLQ